MVVEVACGVSGGGGGYGGFFPRAKIRVLIGLEPGRSRRHVGTSRRVIPLAASAFNFSLREK